MFLPPIHWEKSIGNGLCFFIEYFIENRICFDKKSVNILEIFGILFEENIVCFKCTLYIFPVVLDFGSYYPKVRLEWVKKFLVIRK